MRRVPVAAVKNADCVIGVGTVSGEGTVEADESDFIVDLGLLATANSIGTTIPKKKIKEQTLTLRSGREDILLVYQTAAQLSDGVLDSCRRRVDAVRLTRSRDNASRLEWSREYTSPKALILISN